VGRVDTALLSLLWLALLPAIGLAAEPVALPALSARVTDLTNTLDATQRGRLEAQLAAIERSGRAQVAVLLLPTTQPETIEQFGIRLAEAWKIGRKGADNGLIVIVAKDDRKMRIEVGYGLEGPIPDAIAKRIIAERMAPAFKQGDFFGGLRAAVEGLDQALGGAPGPAPAAAPAHFASGNTTSGGQDLTTWGFLLLIGSGILHAMFGLFGSLLAAGVGGWLAFMFFGSWLAAAIAAVVVFLLSLAKLSSGGGGSGGYSGGGGFSSGGGGGFSGGGSFGGGGSSGSW
jgi:uncharacterized protein